MQEMEIQGIPGFQLTTPTVILADGRPLSRVTRFRGAHLNKFRAPADTKTIDFRRGLEAYVPPRIVRRPNSSQSQRKQRSKKDNRSVSSENVLDIKEKERELEAMANADIKDAESQDRTSSTHDGEVSVTLECQDMVSISSSPEYSIPDPSIVCTCDGVVGMESKRYGDFSSTQQSKAWFEKTLQEYEDLKKSVEAHISSTPSERSEMAADVNKRCVSHVWEEIPVQEKTFSDIEIMDADELCRKNGHTTTISEVGSPALSTYSCGCAAKPFVSNPPPALDMDAVQDAAWTKMVETVAQLRETNRALQQTVKELRERQHHHKPYDVGALAETKADSPQCSGTSLYEPELRKRVLGTLKNSVQRMETLMVALRDEQEKSRKLSTQLQGFLSASKDRTPQPTPPRSVPWSRASSPERCARFENSHQFQTFPMNPPGGALWSRATGPEQSSIACSRDHEYMHQRPTSPPTGYPSRSPSPTPVLCTIQIDSIGRNSQNRAGPSPSEMLLLSLSEEESESSAADSDSHKVGIVLSV